MKSNVSWGSPPAGCKPPCPLRMTTGPQAQHWGCGPVLLRAWRFDLAGQLGPLADLDAAECSHQQAGGQLPAADLASGGECAEPGPRPRVERHRR